VTILLSNRLKYWKCRLHFAFVLQMALKRGFTEWHVTFQNACIFSNTAVRISNLASPRMARLNKQVRIVIIWTPCIWLSNGYWKHPVSDSRTDICHINSMCVFMAVFCSVGGIGDYLPKVPSFLGSLCYGICLWWKVQESCLHVNHAPRRMVLVSEIWLQGASFVVFHPQQQ
jgi:hypothetical protein